MLRALPIINNCFIPDDNLLKLLLPKYLLFLLSRQQLCIAAFPIFSCCIPKYLMLHDSSLRGPHDLLLSEFHQEYCLYFSFLQQAASDTSGTHTSYPTNVISTITMHDDGLVVLAITKRTAIFLMN